MGLNKVMTYAAIAIAGIVALIFSLDLAVGIFGRLMVMDIMFILAAALLLWQGIETILELR